MRPALLVVDDDEDLRDLLSVLLSDAGFDVEVARHGQEALERAAARRPDLILLDIMMPVMDGPAFLARYRAEHDGAAPVVVMTAGEHAAAIARSIGACGWLAKPFTPDALIHSVVAHLPG